MEFNESRNHRCKTKRHEKIENTKNKLLEYYAEYGDGFLLSILEGLKSELISNQGCLEEDLKTQKKKTKAFENKLEKDRVQCVQTFFHQTIHTK